jgi:hypothetical protein
VTTWLRRNAIGLGATALLLPAAIWVSFSDGWKESRSSEPHRPIAAAAGLTAPYAGAEWRLDQVTRHQDHAGEPLPDGADLVVVRIEVTPADAEARESLAGCRVQLSDGETHWTSPSSELLDWRTEPGASWSCTGEDIADSSYLVEKAFLVPSGAAHTGEVQVIFATLLPEFITLPY